jgi:hypothetical protein
MIKTLLKLFYLLFSLTVLLYVALPNFDFPLPPPGSLQSNEPADRETEFRRAYFTDLTRAEVLDWYRNQFNRSKIFNLTLPTLLLNYPPEESQTIIRDQTRSTFLQEIVNPFRETVFVNGYEPKPDDDENKIVIDGKRWRQKIIIRYIPTNVLLRFSISLMTLIALPVLLSAFKPEVKFYGNLLATELKKVFKLKTHFKF